MFIEAASSKIARTERGQRKIWLSIWAAFACRLMFRRLAVIAFNRVLNVTVPGGGLPMCSHAVHFDIQQVGVDGRMARIIGKLERWHRRGWVFASERGLPAQVGLSFLTLSRVHLLQEWKHSFSSPKIQQSKIVFNTTASVFETKPKRKQYKKTKGCVALTLNFTI